MKRSMLILTVSVCAIFLATVSAFVQERLRPQLSERAEAPQRITDPDNLPQTYLNQNRLHKLIINNDDAAVYDQLAQSNAIREEVNYGSFRLIVVDEEAAGGREALQTLPGGSKPPASDRIDGNPRHARCEISIRLTMPAERPSALQI